MIDQQPRARRRHEQILDAALRVFARKGYQDAAVDDIASESSTSKGGVYFHFPGKQAILLALLDRSAARLRSKIEEAIAREDDPVARADAALLAVFNSFASHRALARLFMIEAMSGGKEFQRRVAQQHAEFAQMIQVHLDDAVTQGAIEPIDTRLASTAWFGALNEIVTRWLITGEPKRLHDAYASLRPLLMRSVGVRRPGDVMETRGVQDIERVLHDALSRARVDGKRFVSRTFELPRGFDAVTLFDNCAGDKRLWLQPAQAFALVAAGAVEAREIRGAGRFDAVKSFWHEVERHMDADGAATLDGREIPSSPLVLASFAFEPGAWHPEDLPDAVAVLPRLLFLQSGFTHAVSITLPASASETDVMCASADVRRLLQAPPGAAGGPVTLDLIPDVSRVQWDDGVNTVLKAVADGRVEKAVLARSVRVVSGRPFEVGTVLRALAERNPRATVFAASHGEVCFLGATPERLVRVQDGVASVDCLAGTIRLAGDAAESDELAAAILRDSKELHEHEVVLRAIKEALDPVSTSVDAPARPVIRRTADLQHLHTPITAVVKEGVELFDLVERLHPTPAMGGYPREVALKLLSEVESFDRGWYAAPFGWVDAAGNGDFAVAIRSALLKSNEARLYAGSGIVAGSDAAREFEETELKLRAMLWALRQE
jgi:isochorismate synthase